jgi:NUMOD4 motif
VASVVARAPTVVSSRGAAVGVPLLWKEINDWPGYLISNYGHVHNLSTGNILLPVSGRGRRVSLQHDGHFKQLRVARLVLQTFLGPPPSKRSLACHKDDNVENNCISNLYWGTKSTNQHDAIRNGRMTYSSERNKKLSNSLRAFYKAGGKCR